MNSYNTVSKPVGPLLLKEKKSKFFGYCFPVRTEENVKEHLEMLRQNYPSANHVCYAWHIGIEQVSYRANDDGEPSNSAGMPIYGQIQSFDVTNILVAVVRVFGGTKLGVGGLISAYRETAKLTLETANIVTKTIKKTIKIEFEYAEMDAVMRIIKMNQLEIISQESHLHCKIEVAVPKSRFEKIMATLHSHHKLKISALL